MTRRSRNTAAWPVVASPVVFSVSVSLGSVISKVFKSVPKFQMRPRLSRNSFGDA